MKTKLTFFFLLVSTVFFAQSENDRKVYLDSTWKETTQDKQVYYRIIKDYHLTLPEYTFTDYYKSGKIQMEGISTEKEYLRKKGVFKFYFENGNLKSEVNFEDNKKLGKFIGWYENGVKKIEGEYVSDTSELKPNFIVNQFWNKDNQQTVTDGTGFIDEENDEFIEKGNVVNGLKNGVWEGKSLGLKYTYVETYDKGKLISGNSIDKENVSHNYTVIENPPRPKKGLQHFYNFIARKFRIPKGSDTINGEMMLSFVINKQGEATELTVLKSLGTDLDNEGMRLIKAYPEWTSGEIRGIKARVLYSLPIKILQ